MNSTELKKLLNLKRNDKIKLVQTLWDNIAAEQNIKLPKEHKELLERRLIKIESGNSTLKDWNILKKKYFSDVEV